MGPRTRVAIALMFSAIAQAATPATAAWERFHGDAANRGFADVDTKPAAAGSVSVPGLGTFAPGAGPVIAPDGTVYLGTREGKLIALHADGKPFWSRDIDAGEAIIASPAIGADGSVYVIGAKSKITKIGTITKTEIGSTLYAFISGGGLLARTPFPTKDLRGPVTAPPNIVNMGGREIILAPAVFTNRNISGVDMRLIGFSTHGGIVFDQRVAGQPGVATGGGSFSVSAKDAVCLIPPLGLAWCAICGFGQCDYDPQRIGGTPPPMPGVAIFTFAGGGAPHIIVSDQRHTIRGFTATSAAGLTETFRFRDDRRSLISPPMVLPDGHTLVSTSGGEIVFAGPNASKLPPVGGLGIVYGAPTRTVNGFAAVVGASGLALLNNGKVVSQVSLPPSFTSAAASRTHVFVSTTDALVTLDADAQRELQRFDWVGGGTSPPAIGPDGRVYAIASDILFIFPPPTPLSKPVKPGVVLK